MVAYLDPEADAVYSGANASILQAPHDPIPALPVSRFDIKCTSWFLAQTAAFTAIASGLLLKILSYSTRFGSISSPRQPRDSSKNFVLLKPTPVMITISSEPLI